MSNDLIIKVENGQPIDHPMNIDNIRLIYPGINFENLPNNLMWFKRIEAPELGPYEKNQKLTYKINGTICQDEWSCENMTEQEVQEKQNRVKLNWSKVGYSSWIFNTQKCDFDPPVPYPNDGKYYTWDEVTVNWKLNNGIS